MRLLITDVDDPTEAWLPTLRGVVFEVLEKYGESYRVRVVDTTRATALYLPRLGAEYSIPSAYIRRGIAREV
jgi:hypothetical protein